jgi:hypothetical protein
MAKTDHFYIRSQVSGINGETEIDLGAFVDALGKSVLRIHSISIMFNDSTQTTAGSAIALTAANSEEAVAWQLTTQTQTNFVTLNDKSVISLGCTQFVNDSAVGGNVSFWADIGDRVDQKWKDGYLVAVEQIFFKCDAAGGQLANPLNASIILDCTVETLSEKAAMALALSQQ